MAQWISLMFSDDKGTPSSTRVMAFTAFVVACVMAIWSIFQPVNFEYFLTLLAYSASVKSFQKWQEKRTETLKK